MKALVLEEFLGDMEKILERAIPWVGLIKEEGQDGGGPKMVNINHLFIRWPKGRTKDHWWEDLEQGWKALKICVELVEMEVTIVGLMEIVKEELREWRGLCLWKRAKLLNKILPPKSRECLENMV